VALVAAKLQPFRTPRSAISLVPPRIAPVSTATAATAIAGATVSTAATATAVIAVSATASASTAIVISAAAASTTPAAAEAALIARARFIDTERTPLHLLAIELGDGVLCISLGRHCHKSESAGFAREFVLHQQHFGYCAGLRKHVLQLELRGRERKVAYVQSISHSGLDFSLLRADRLPRGLRR
jgi:hypothetical protein